MMTIEERTEYSALCRGAATFILLGKKELAVQSAALAEQFHLDSAVVAGDIDAIVQTERHKSGGVFELTSNISTSREK